MPEEPNRGRAKVSKYFASFCLISLQFNFILILIFVLFCLFTFQPLVTLVLSHHTTKTFTHFTSVTSPFQPACLSSRSFHWPSPQNESLITCCTTSPATPFSRNETLLPHLFFFLSLCMFRAHPNRPEDSKNTLFFPCIFSACECTVKLCLCASHVFSQCVCFCCMLKFSAYNLEGARLKC